MFAVAGEQIDYINRSIMHSQVHLSPILFIIIGFGFCCVAAHVLITSALRNELNCECGVRPPPIRRSSKEWNNVMDKAKGQSATRTYVSNSQPNCEARARRSFGFQQRYFSGENISTFDANISFRNSHISASARRAAEKGRKQQIYVKQ